MLAPVFFFGFGLFFALPAIGWAVYHGVRDRSPAWVLVGSYGTVLLVLSVVQVRFAFPLSLVASVFTAIVFVHLVSVIGEFDPPAVEERPRFIGREVVQKDETGDRDGY